MRVDVRGLRDALKLSREDFGALVPVDKRTVRRWENGEGEPSPMAYHRLCAIRDEHTEPETTVPRRRPVTIP